MYTHRQQQHQLRAHLTARLTTTASRVHVLVSSCPSAQGCPSARGCLASETCSCVYVSSRMRYGGQLVHQRGPHGAVRGKSVRQARRGDDTNRIAKSPIRSSLAEQQQQQLRRKLYQYRRTAYDVAVATATFNWAPPETRSRYMNPYASDPCVRYCMYVENVPEQKFRPHEAVVLEIC